MMDRRFLQFVLLGLSFFLLLFSSTGVLAEENPLAPPDTSSPQATLNSFVDSIDQSIELFEKTINQHIDAPGLFPSAKIREQEQQATTLLLKASRCLNLEEIPPRLKLDIAISKSLLLKEILDRIELPSDSDIPDAATVSADESLTYWTLPNTEIDIVKVGEGAVAEEFLFSRETVANLEDFYQKIKHLPYKSGVTGGVYQLYHSLPNTLIGIKLLYGLPSWLNTLYFEQTLWQWIGLAFTLLFVVWILWVCFRWNWQRIKLLSPPRRTWETMLPPVFTIIILEVAIYFFDFWLGITGRVLLNVVITQEIFSWTMMAIAVILLCNGIAETIIATPNIDAQGLDASGIRIIFRLVGLSTGVTILILGVERVGLSIAPLLASLGIGGLALALAARPTLENIIAGLIVLTDRPVTVGEYCSYGDQEGTILEIGLRSTRVLALNGDLVSIPNSHFIDLVLSNKSRREKILLSQTIGLRYESTSDQLRYVLTKLREMVIAHPKLLEKGSRVRFVKYGDYSIDVEVFAYVDTGQLLEFLEIQEDILLRIKDIVKEAGTDFAFPSQTMYHATDAGLDRERSGAVVDQVQDWRSKGVLPFPDIPDEQREYLRDTLDYPPKGSLGWHPAVGDSNSDHYE